MASVIVRCKRHGAELAIARRDDGGADVVSWQEFSPAGVQLLRVLRARRAHDPSALPGEFDLSRRRLSTRFETTTRTQPMTSIAREITPWCPDCGERLAIPTAGLRARLAKAEDAGREAVRWSVDRTVGRDPESTARAAEPHPHFDETGRPIGVVGELLERWLIAQLLDWESLSRQLHRDVEIVTMPGTPDEAIAEMRSALGQAIELFAEAAEQLRAAGDVLREIIGVVAPL